MTVKVTLEFKSADEAIVALGKLVGIKTSAAPAGEVGAVDAVDARKKPEQPGAAEPRQRKPRADKGQKRDPYGPRQQEAKGTEAGAPTVASATPDVGTGATGSAPVTSAASAPAAVVKIEDVQAALGEMYEKKGHDISLAVLSRFGVQRGKDLLPEQWAEFIAKAKRVVAGEAP